MEKHRNIHTITCSNPQLFLHTFFSRVFHCSAWTSFNYESKILPLLPPSFFLFSHLGMISFSSPFSSFSCFISPNVVFIPLSETTPSLLLLPTPHPAFVTNAISTIVVIWSVFYSALIIFSSLLAPRTPKHFNLHLSNALTLFS